MRSGPIPPAAVAFVKHARRQLSSAGVEGVDPETLESALRDAALLIDLAARFVLDQGTSR